MYHFHFIYLVCGSGCDGTIREAECDGDDNEDCGLGATLVLKEIDDGHN